MRKARYTWHSIKACQTGKQRDDRYVGRLFLFFPVRIKTKDERRAQYLLAAELPGHGHIFLFDALAMVVLEPRQVPAGPAECVRYQRLLRYI